MFTPTAQVEGLVSHAAMPVPVHLEGDRYRVFYTGRDSETRSHTAFFDLDLNAPGEPVAVSNRPVLSPGGLGAFDEFGAMGSCAVRVDDELWLYYVGWNRPRTVPFLLSVGLARWSPTANRFERLHRGPVMDRSPADPCFSASPFVLRASEGWKAWYISCDEWRVHDGAPRHYYNIKYATSDDGTWWRRDGVPCIDFADPDEHAFSRPAVVEVDGLYHMWYAFRGRAYRIGYAVSRDGRSWSRRDAEAGIGTGPGWESEMVAYPNVFEHGDQLYMLYNGNGYGSTGIGLAVTDVRTLTSGGMGSVG